MSILPLPNPVLVTGGAGFIGAHLVERLLADDNQVISFDVPGVRVPETWRDRIRIVTGDIANENDVCNALQGVGTVFHTAAVVSDWAPRQAYERVTIQGSRFVFEQAVKNKTRVLLLSSGAVYGDKIGRGVLCEDDPLGHPIGIYSEYKQKQEMLGWEYHRQHGMQLSVVRPTKVFGPGSKPWVHEVAKNLLSGKPTLINGGNYIPGFVYVDNLVDILIRAASLPQAQGRVYNGYDGTTATLRQYFTDLARIVGAPSPKAMPGWFAKILAAVIGPTWKILNIQSRPLLTNDSLRMISSNYEISTKRVRNELGFTSLVSYEEGMRRIEAYWHTL
ncbi:MAG: NAD(P)-dependent oxidoreductase [Chloroflexi bacterium]|nr:NAD(P)-dependent oxidoreductase [Chloroflexota bacterium]